MLQAQQELESFVTLTTQHLGFTCHSRQRYDFWVPNAPIHCPLACPHISYPSFSSHIRILLGWEGSVNLLKFLTVILISAWPTELKCLHRQWTLLCLWRDDKGKPVLNWENHWFWPYFVYSFFLSMSYTFLLHFLLYNSRIPVPKGQMNR